MQWIYQEYWKRKDDSKRIRRAFFFSIILHLAIFLPFFFYKIKSPEPIPLVFQVSLESPVPNDSIEQVTPPATKEPEPKVEQPKPEQPKPEPKVEQPKPEQPKPEPKVEQPKPEQPKPEPKPEKKQTEKKPEPQKPKSPKPKKESTQPQKNQQTDKKQDPITPSAGPKAQVANLLPPELEWWARQVQRKIEDVWVVPDGIKIDNENNVAEVSFWINRNGELIEQPKVTKEASDPTLAESGVQAILLAAPFPRFPDSFNKDEQLIVYTFSLQ
ncbi:MAG TPA: TonB C-terminal domain-containing protein [Candidatus Hydrogenedens sp.]|nr:TonB C-terminal domain-containing protein [Candidatus Hydrogenedens sp.]